MHIIAYQYKSQARSKQSPKDKSNSGHPGHNSCLFPKILVAILLGGSASTFPQPFPSCMRCSTPSTPMRAL